MTSYTRTPRRATVHCPVAGCKWVKTYFELHNRDARFALDPQKRARLGLNAHIAARHTKATTLINGR